MGFRRFLVALYIAAFAPLTLADDRPNVVQTLIPWLLDESESLKGIPFSEVVAATSGKHVLPVDRSNKEVRRILGEIGAALDAVLAMMNSPESSVRKAKRVNEMSSYFENALRETLNARPGFSCTIPKTESGRTQRSGYPDLRLIDKNTNRVFYLDPKLFATASKSSSLRTFYFEPKRATNKVNDDAVHLIVGIEHARNKDGAIHFTRWELIDLANFRVKLKAEFEGSNADLYRPEAVVGTSAASK